jgi:ribokinase
MTVTIPEVVVVGSVNMDLMARVPRLPAADQTVSGTGLAIMTGGKGANQAAAVSRLGARAAIIGCVGDDEFGARLRAGLEEDQVDCRGLQTMAGGSSGAALRISDDAARCRVVVVPGGNGQLRPTDIDAAEPLLAGARVVVLQLEIPIETVEYTARRARALSKPVVLNAWPARPLSRALLGCVAYLVVNEMAAAALTGAPVSSIAEATAAARRLRSDGAGIVLVTLGANGVVTVAPDGERHAPAPRAHVVDTTAAGDTFVGGLCAALVRGSSLPAAVAFGQAAAALCVARPGARSSIPFAHEVALPELT